MLTSMDEIPSGLTLTDIAEVEHLGRNDIQNDHENGDQVNTRHSAEQYVLLYFSFVARLVHYQPTAHFSLTDYSTFSSDLIEMERKPTRARTHIHTTLDVCTSQSTRSFAIRVRVNVYAYQLHFLAHQLLSTSDPFKSRISFSDGLQSGCRHISAEIVVNDKISR